MKLTILEDASERQDLFFWAGPIQLSMLESWLAEHSWNIPQELKYLWSETGGGDFFDTETIFAPFSDLWADDSVEQVNRYQRQKGLPEHYLLFHYGIRLSAVDCVSSQYLFLNETTFQIQQTFSSLEHWYTEGIRPVFEQKYSLRSVSAMKSAPRFEKGL